jgi:hypothetical protein
MRRTMADLPVARRMRRFRDKDGVEYDELPDGLLRRRLKADDPSPIPRPMSRSAIEYKAGALQEIDPATLAKPPAKRPLPPVLRKAWKK